MPLVPGADGTVDLRVLVDAGVVEVFPGGGAAAAARLRRSVEAGCGWPSPRTARRPAERLVAHGMEPGVA